MKVRFSKIKGTVVMNNMPIWVWILVVGLSGGTASFVLKEIKDWWRKRLSKEEKAMIKKINSNGGCILHIAGTNDCWKFIEDDRILRLLEEKNIVYFDKQKDMVFLKEKLQKKN